MSSFLEKLKKRGHRRQGSTTSKSSCGLGNVDESPADGNETKLWLPEGPAFRTGPLVFSDDHSSTHGNSPEIHSHLGTEKANDGLSKKEQWDLGESTLEPGVALLRCQRKSRLTKTLSDVLQDPAALGYFLAFMEAQGYKHLVKFWLEAETFRVAAQSISVDKHSDTAVLMKNETESEGHLANGDVTNSNRSSGRMSKSVKQMTEQDAVAIFSKYISKEAAHSIGATDDLRNTVINSICDVDGHLDADCFSVAQQFVFNILEKRFFEQYMNSVAHCKYVLELLTSSTVYITDILYDDAALFHFTEFMEQEGQRAVIEFWLAADNFQQHLVSVSDRQNECNPEQAQEDAMVLYDKYFSMQATSPLGFGDEIRTEVENNICREDGVLSDCFDKPFRYVLNYMEHKYLPLFLKSTWYARYLSELIKAAQYYDLDLPNPNRSRHKKCSTTGSTASSGDASSSTSERSRIRNTLLAQESPLATARRRQVDGAADSSGNMLIETKTYDPDTLWRRDTSKIRFAHVDPVGRYVREYTDAKQHKRTKSGSEVLTEAVKKFVNKDSKEQQALAEEVAALIIQDVTNMTCGGSSKMSLDELC